MSLEDFFADHPNFSDATKKFYKCVIPQFQKFLENKPWKRVTRKDIIEFLNTKDTDVTKQHYLEAIKRYLKWSYDYELPKKIHQLTIRVRRKKLRPSDLPTPEEIVALIHNMPTLREKAALSLLYGTGARISEVLKAKVGDIQPVEDVFHLFTTGKTGEVQYPIKFCVLPTTTRWLEFLSASPDSPLFPHRRDPKKSLGSDTFRIYLEQARQAAGIEKRIYPHLFRHLRNTELVRRLGRTKTKKIMGYDLGSNVIDRYVHLTHGDRIAFFLESEGRTAPEPSKPQSLPISEYQHPLVTRSRDQRLQDLENQLNEMTDKVILLCEKLKTQQS